MCRHPFKAEASIRTKRAARFVATAFRSDWLFVRTGNCPQIFEVPVPSHQAARALSSLRGVLPIFILLSFLFCSEMGLAAVSPGLTITAGNGQVTAQFYNTVVPLSVQAADANGRPIPNLLLTWTVTQGQGTIVAPPDRTDASGVAVAYYRGDVTPGHSFSQQTVTVSSTIGSVNFLETTVLNSLSNGQQAAMPSVQLISPPPENRSLTGRSGTTITDAIEVLVGVQSGPEQGNPIPNIAIRIVDAIDPTVSPAAHCAGQPLTGSNGVARCDLVLTASPGTYSISVEVGEFVTTPPIFLTISAASACVFTLSTTSQAFQAVGGIGTITVNGQSGCPWTASSSASWITINNPSGSGYGGTGFIVAANAGSARSANINIAGQSITVTQAGVTTGGTQPLSIVTSSNLPSAVAGTAYTASLAATGGRPPYNWTANTTFPAGLTLIPSTGAITGTPSNTGSYSLPVTLTDQAGSVLNQTFTLTIQTAGTPSGTGPTVTNTGFPNAAVGVAYQQVLKSVGGCASPFSPAPVYTISSGSLPAGLSIAKIDDRQSAITGTPTTAGTFNFTVTVTDSCNGSGSSNFTLTVTGTSTQPGTSNVTATPASLTFFISLGQSGNPPDQTIALSGPSNSLFNLGAATQSGGFWLSVAGQNFGNFPATITVHAANLGNFTAGTYTGMISVISNGGTFSIPVTLVVSGAAATLVAAPASVNVSVPVGGASQQQSLAVTNAGGSAHFTILTSTANGGSWLSVNSVAADTPANLTVTLNPAGLQPSLMPARFS